MAGVREPRGCGFHNHGAVSADPFTMLTKPLPTVGNDDIDGLVCAKAPSTLEPSGGGGCAVRSPAKGRFAPFPIDTPSPFECPRTDRGPVARLLKHPRAAQNNPGPMAKGKHDYNWQPPKQLGTDIGTCIHRATKLCTRHSNTARGRMGRVLEDIRSTRVHLERMLGAAERARARTCEPV